MDNIRENLEKIVKEFDKKEEYEKSLSILMTYMDIEPDDKIRYMIGREYYHLKRYEEAIKVFESLTDNEDTIVASKSFVQLINIAIDLNDTRKIIDYYEKYSSLYKPSHRIQYYVSQCYCKVGEPLKTLKVLEKVDYNSLDFNVERANAYFQLRQYQKALDALEEPVAEFTESKNSGYMLSRKYSLKGTILLKLKLYAQAMMAFKKVIEISPEQNRVYYDSKMSLATLYYRIGDRKGAINEALDIISNCKTAKILSDANAFLGRVYLSVGDTEKANIHFAKCADKEKFIGFGKIAYYNGDFKEALKYLKEAPVSNKFAFKEVHTLIAQIMFRLKDYERFASEYQTIIADNKHEQKFDRDIQLLNTMRYYIEKTSDMKFEGGQGYLYGMHCNAITDYNSKDIIEKIKERIQYQTDYDIKFPLDTDFEGLYNFILKYIDLYERKCDGMEDIYLIDLKELNCPYSSELVKVVCLCDSYKILNIYPDNYRKHLERTQESNEATNKTNKKCDLN